VPRNRGCRPRRPGANMLVLRGQRAAKPS
jgi:hypothetical protein